MKLSKEELQQNIRKIVEDVTKIRIESYDTNLLDSSININPANFLYIFDELEKELKLPVVDIFKENKCDVMTIKNLCRAIMDLNTQKT